MAAAAFVSWGLYGSFTEYILTSPDHKSQATLTLSALVGAFLVGIEGSKIFYGREPEARADGSIIVESPPADIPIPACFHLADYNDLLALAVKGNAKKIARIRSGFEDGLCGRRAPTDSWGDIRPIRPDPAFLELPVAERAAGGESYWTLSIGAWAWKSTSLTRYVTFRSSTPDPLIQVGDFDD
jgi:hypothetical protein